MVALPMRSDCSTYCDSHIKAIIRSERFMTMICVRHSLAAKHEVKEVQVIIKGRAQLVMWRHGSKSLAILNVH
jgi:hypothetical protein